MISVILIWVYMIGTCYILGFTVLKGIIGKKGYAIKRESSYLIAGITVVTIYAQFFSIFYKVGFLANILMLGVCLVCICCCGKDMLGHCKAIKSRFVPAKTAGMIFLFLLFAYGTSRGIIHYDTGLYHAQSIRWIEEFGIVPGLGNLHVRLAYNSASFCLSALYSFAFLSDRSYHCCAGFLAVLLAYTCVEGFSKEKLRKPSLSFFARLMGIYYLLIIFDEMISPASDYFMVLTVFYIMIRWLDLLEQQEKSYLPYALLSLLCVSVVTIKLSGALVVLLAVKPAVMMLREKRGREIAKFLGLGFITALPFFIRNVILSGYLLYPFPSVDLFSLDFKIPKEVVEYDAREIQVWGRGVYDVTRYDEPVTKWLPDWFGTQDPVNKIFFFMALGAIVILIGICMDVCRKRKWEDLDFLHISGVTAGCFLFWLISAPLVRYGCVFLWMLPVLIWGFLYLKISPHLDRYMIFTVFVIMIGVYKIAVFTSETMTSADTDYLVRQQDYQNFDTIAYEVQGYIFYYPSQGDQTGYDAFPAAPTKVGNIFRGEDIKSGFRHAE